MLAPRTATTAPSAPRIGEADDGGDRPPRSGPASSSIASSGQTSSGETSSGETSSGETSCGQTSCGQTWIALFKESVLRQRVSASTLEAYSLDLAMLARWATLRGHDLVALTTADLTGYVAERIGQGTQLSTLARHLSSFRRFYAFLISHGSIAVNPAVAVWVPKALGTRSMWVRDEVLRILLKSPSRRPHMARTSAYRVQRDHAIVCMLYGTELGISDVRLLRWQQIDEDRNSVRAPVRNGAMRSYDLDPTLVASLKAVREGWALAGFEHAESPYCFPTASGLPMSRQALRHVVQRWARERGQSEAVTPSALRQTGRARQSAPRRPATAMAAVV